MASINQQFMSDLRAALSQRPNLMANVLLITIILFFLWVLYWASEAEIDQISSGMGRVIPSRQVQIVQNLEGGILSELIVEEGDFVKKGQILLQLDDTQFSSDFMENRMRFLGLQAVSIRLNAELNKKKPVFPDALKEQLPNVARTEASLYGSRATELKSTIGKFQQQIEQRKSELAETQARISQLMQSISLLREEMAILQPLVEKGINAPIELIRLMREENQYVGDLEIAKKSINRINSSIVEVREEINESKAQFRSRALKELNEAQVNMSALREILASRDDKVRRAIVRSPVEGTVKQIFINTVGGVVRPGEELVEIVPTEDSLIIEARIRPSDIAFIHPGQEANVKITAYDYTVYGFLTAKLQHISADTILDEVEKESYYLIRVKTNSYKMRDKKGNPLPIIPGMTASVDIITGKHTVLQYLLKPFLKIRERALREG